MSKIANAIREIVSIDELSEGTSMLHRIHPLGKIIITIVYIVTVVSFKINDLTGLISFILYPVILSQIGEIPIRVGIKKLKIVLLLIFAVGIWNPILDREVILQLGTLSISSGMISFITLLLKGILALLASFYLIATTDIEEICYALSIVKIPNILTTLILISYRYIGLLMKEVDTMQNAYNLRAPGQKGIHISTWGSFLGQLLLRSMDRANELFRSMELRGFHGSFFYANVKKATISDYFYTGICATLIILFRAINVSVILGSHFI